VAFPFDAVVILGKELRRDPERARRELRARAAAAAAALRAGAHRVATLEARLRGQPVSGAALVAEHLDELGVDPARVVRREQTRSTREEALLGAAWLWERGAHRGLVLTASYHVPRARRLFREAGAAAEVHAPEALWRWATPQERRWIEAGTPDAAALRTEARTEALFGALEAALMPLPHMSRAMLEIRAGAWLRGG